MGADAFVLVLFALHRVQTPSHRKSSVAGHRPARYVCKRGADNHKMVDQADDAQIFAWMAAFETGVDIATGNTAFMRGDPFAP